MTSCPGRPGPQARPARSLARSGVERSNIKLMFDTFWNGAPGLGRAELFADGSWTIDGAASVAGGTVERPSGAVSG